jgi:hypothetical protein
MQSKKFWHSTVFRGLSFLKGGWKHGANYTFLIIGIKYEPGAKTMPLMIDRKTVMLLKAEHKVPGCQVLIPGTYT